MGLVRTIIAFLFTFFCLVILFPVGLLGFLLSLLGPKKQMAWVVYSVAWLWGKGIIFISGCSLTVEGKENIPRQGSVCFVGNHQGYFDVILALANIGRPFGFIAKKELILVPFLDIWILLLGGLFIDRKNIRQAIRTMNSGIQKIRDGGSMLIFPEGTRSRGRGLLPFRSGAIRLATHSLAPIVPMAISGSYEVFEKNKLLHPVPVRIAFCPPISTADMSIEERRHNLVDQVRSAIEGALVSG